ncbi:MAG: WbqC family protein [Alistipes sp.]|nr:WbqC family protein [Alistipes sp.]
MENRCILPLAYLPSVSWFAAMRTGRCIIDTGEHFIKRSERNRTAILAPDGPMTLTVQVSHADRPRTPMRDVRIDYSKRWQHQHWGALVAAYKGSPYFDYYADKFEPFYRREWRFLVDYNRELLEVLCRQTGLPVPPVSDRYVEASAGDLDLRPKQRKDPAFVAEPYVQVFADRLPFAPDLSFIDLLFAEGPNAVSVLSRCRCAE